MSYKTSTFGSHIESRLAGAQLEFIIYLGSNKSTLVIARTPAVNSRLAIKSQEL